MNKNLGYVLIAAVAILLLALFRDSLPLNVQRLFPGASGSSPAASAPASALLGQQPATYTDAPAAPGDPAPSSFEPPRYSKCFDGSALTVTGGDSNQVNFKCASGAIGAYTR